MGEILAAPPRSSHLYFDTFGREVQIEDMEAACIEPVTTIVLAGGASSRMGRPKTLLPFGGQLLIERVVSRARGISPDVIVVSGARQALPAMPPRVTVIEDAIPFQGPLAAILYGMRAATTALCFVCAGDLPFFSVELARALLDLASGHDAVVPRWDQHPQPLFAAYRRRMLPMLEELLAAGHSSPRAVLGCAGVREVGEDEVANIDPQGLSFFDVDTTGAYERALRMAGVPRKNR